MTGHAWFKTLPAEWALVELKWVARIYSGGTPDRSRPEFWTDGDIPWLASGCVNQWKVTEPSEYITKKGFEASSARFVPRGAVLIGLAGQGKTKGTAALSLIEATINQSVAAIVCGSVLDPRFLHYWLSVNHSNIRGLSGGDLRDGLNHGHVGAIPVPLPPRVLQTRIADYLDRETATIDALIEKQRRLLAVLLERRREAIRAAVFGSNEACLNADPLEALPEGWRRAKLRHVATMHTGHTPSRSKPEYWEDTSIPWFTLADVWQLRPGTRKYLGETKSRISPLGLENSAAELLPKGTVVLSRTASVGFTGIMPRAMATSQDYWNWVCGPQLCPEFLWNVFRAMKSDFDSLKAGSTHKTIYQADAAALQIPLPPVQTQQAIVDHLDAETAKIDALIAKAERFIELAQERRAALITAAVTGQIEIPTED